MNVIIKNYYIKNIGRIKYVWNIKERGNELSLTKEKRKRVKKKKERKGNRE